MHISVHNEPAGQRAARAIRCLAAAMIVTLASNSAAQGFGGVFDLDALSIDGGGAGVDGTIFAHPQEGANLGAGVSIIGDINNDGIDDFAIAAAGSTLIGADSPGEIFVVFGTSSGFPAEFDLSSLLPVNGGDGSAGFVIYSGGSDTTNALGLKIVAMGDTNGDGIDDFMFSNFMQGFDDGVVYLVYGRDGSTFGASLNYLSLVPSGNSIGNAIVADSQTLFGFVGLGLGAGDFNSDGLADYIIGAPRAEDLGQFNTGRTFLAFGVNGGYDANPFSLSGIQFFGGFIGFEIKAETRGDFFGFSASFVGDVNNDGFEDILVGAISAGPVIDGIDEAGRAYLIYGGNDAFGGLLSVSTLSADNGGDGSVGTIFKGSDADEFFGATAASVGDINNDGIDDFAIGASSGNSSLTEVGRAFVYFGSEEGYGAERTGQDLLIANGGDGSDGFVITSSIANLRGVGFAISALGDINGDGLDDLGVSVPFELDGLSNGAAFVLFGRNGGFGAEYDLDAILNGASGDGIAFTGLSDQEGAEIGLSINGGGDVNGDGINDILIGAFMADIDGSIDSGAGYLVYGKDDAGTLDADGDGIADSNDNCVNVINATQRDTDGDSIGNSCDADLNNDCVVNVVDLGLLRARFFGSDADADFDGDGVVNVVDLGIMRQSFFQAPGPSGLPNLCAAD